MLLASEMDPSVLGTVDDSFDPNIFSFIDLGNTPGSSGDQVDFNWVDDFITSTETASDIEGPTSSQDASSAPITIQQPAPVQTQQAPPQQQQQQQQQQLLHNVLQKKQQQQQPQAPPVGKVIMAMGQSSQQQTLAVAASSDNSTVTPQLLATNQSSILHSNVAGSQAMAPPFILKASTPIQLVNSSVSQSTAVMGGTPQQFVPAASGLSSISASQRSSPLLSRSLTPNMAPTTTHTTSHLSGINLLQVQQSPQITQTLPLSNFVANQQNLQGHAVLTAQGSNIVHTQNALIQNPNVVNVNVAHVLSNQLPQLQVLHTPQGKIYVQSPASNHTLPQQLCLGQVAGAQPVQMAGSQAVQMAGNQAVQMAAGSQAVQVAGQPVQLAGAQTMQVASNVGLAQPTAVIAQPQSNVALGSSSGMGQQQASYNFINFGGSQGQILVQRMPSSATPVTQSQPLPQGPIFLRTVNGQQQLVQQPTLQSTPSTTQLPQQLVAQTAGTTHNIPLQQFLTGVGGPSLRLVGQATTVSTPQASSLSTTTTSTNPSIVLQPLVTATQVPLLGQQVTTQAGSNSGTVTLNLTGQNLNLHQLQNLSTLQLNSSQSQPIIVQQQQQQQQPQQQQHLTVQQTVVRAPSPKVSAGSASKKSKSKNTATSSLASSAVPALSADNILSAALMSSGILDDEDFQSLMNGSDMTDASLVQPEVTVTPSPSSVRTTPTPPPPTPPSTAKKSKKKKKEVVSGGAVQHMVLGSTAMRSSVTITTASATTVTTTVSQSAMSAHTLSTSTHSLVSAPVVSLGANSSVQSAVAQTTTAPSISMSILPSSSLPFTSTTTSTSSTLGGGRGRPGPPNVTVKSVGAAVQGLSAEDRQELYNIQASLNKLREQASQDQNSLAFMQQLDMRRRKILAANSNTITLIRQHQQQQQQQQQQQPMPEKQPEPGLASGAMQIRLQGPSVTTSTPVQPSVQAETVSTEGRQVSLQVKGAQAMVPVQCTTLGQVAGAQGQLTGQAAGLDVKPLVGTPSAPVLTIQPKSNSKLALLSPKPDPAAPSSSQTGAGKVAVDVKPVLGVGGVEIPATSSGPAQGSTFTTPTGNVIMAMTNPPATGQAATSQPKMLRIQIGGHNTQAVAFPKAATTPVTTSTQHVVLPSPHKVGISSSSTVTTIMTSVTTTPAVSHGAAVSVSPNQARPVQIKIANQLLTVQLTQQQQEKLELHLSRMTLEQQQAFLRQQQHILAKLQHRVDAQHNSSQAAPTQKSTAASGSDPPSTSSTPAAAVVSAAEDSVPPVQQAAQKISTTSTLTTTPTQQLPVTVQVLIGSQPKTEGGAAVGPAAGSTPKSSGLRCLNLDIPKSSMIHSQLSRDQEHAVNPDTRTPFKDHREACRRLLRYHVHQSHEPSLEQMEEFDRNFEKVSEDLMGKKETMMAKFQLLLLKDSMRLYPTSEQVLLSRMWSSEMQILQREERELVNTDPDAFVPMPMSYLEKDLSKNENEDSEEEESPPPSEEEEEEEESKGEESEAEHEQLADTCPVEETAPGRTDTQQCEPSLSNYFDSSPYPAEDPVSMRHQAQVEEEDPVWDPQEEEEDPVWDPQEEDPVWDPQEEDRSGVWEECREEPHPEEYKDDHHARDQSSEADHFHSSFNDSFEASTPVGEDHSHTHTSPPRESSSAAEEQSSFQSESSRSSPPRPEPPARTMVKLVIRNDGSGFTSKLLEKRRSSDVGERRSLRSRSHSGHERGEVKKIKKEPVTEEVEYIDVENSKYSKGVSVKLERLSERTSQEYGLNIAGRASSGVRVGEVQKTSADPTTTTVTSASTCGPQNMVSSKSGRKRRGGEAELPVNSKSVKRESDFSGLTSSGCDGPREGVFREVKEERGFYVGSAMESLDHFDSEDDEDRGRPYGDDLRVRIGQSVIDVRGEVPAHKAHSSLPIRSSASYRPSAVNSVSSLVEEDNEDKGLARPMDTQDMEHPVFAQPLSSSFLRSHRLAESSPSHAMETSFDLDNADPQRSMVNPQVQSAIDSILNGSSSGDPYGSTATVPGIECVVDSEDEACRSPPPVSDNGPLTLSPTHRWGQDQSPHDLDAAVRSILR